MFNVQSVSLGTGNYSFLFGQSRWVTQFPTQNRTSPPSTHSGQLYYLLFLIPSSLIPFLLCILSFFVRLKFLSLCSPIYSHINTLVSFPLASFLSLYLGLSAPSCPSGRGTRNVPLFSSGASLNSGVKSSIQNVLLWAAYTIKSSQIFF